jgi:hypothetical protein
MSRFYNVVDLVNRLETEARNARQGRLADAFVDAAEWRAEHLVSGLKAPLYGADGGRAVARTRLQRPAPCRH